ncbi:iron chaperone [Pseudoxanthomonas suwonensis]|jgi:Uncharacterized conserved protein|uniref:iron chaperone n=1 Tax=Pseudoxanthomonas suwonensis TaxID=314722 RepID=UPI00138F67F3|nr:DUF1801 domain-containing protein [Pseudoxanthomonas suwonensis]KAF1701873.1 hypothetical protein CSC68_08045 [Pseudoxanthomonas suwonensis]
MDKPAKPTTVEQYIAAAPSLAQDRLREMRQCLHEAAPEAEESLKWGKPAFSLGTVLFVYSAHKQHISLHPAIGAVAHFAPELAGHVTSGNTIQFPLDQPLPLALIRRIANFRVREVVEQGIGWK